MSLVTVWLLIVVRGTQAIYTVPNIASEKECFALFDAIAATPIYVERIPQFYCIAYEAGGGLRG